jgi:CheY-like chemotaxis protein
MSRILLIEDEEIFVEMFSDSLKRAGFEVTVAKNGAWGIKEALSGGFDLLITDIVMPAMGGEEMIAKLKNDPKTQNMPIVVISASVDDATQKRIEKMGVSSFFVKTKITPTELSEKVKKILAKN